MTDQEKELLRQLQAKEQAEKTQKAQDYESLKDEFVNDVLIEYKELQARLIELKKKVFKEALAFEKIKIEQYGGKKDKHPKVVDSKGNRIHVTYKDFQGYNELADVAAEKVMEFIQSKYVDEEQADLIAAFLDKNTDGQFDSKKINKLRKHSKKYNNPLLTEAIELFDQSAYTRYTKPYVYVKEAQEQGGLKEISLNFPNLAIPDLEITD